MKTGRGMINEILESNKEEYERITGMIFNQETLRFIPYVIDCAMNSSPLERGVMTDFEIITAQCWTEKGLCICYPFNDVVAFPSREFYNCCMELLYDGYIFEGDL